MFLYYFYKYSNTCYNGEKGTDYSALLCPSGTSSNAKNPNFLVPDTFYTLIFALLPCLVSLLVNLLA